MSLQTSDIVTILSDRVGSLLTFVGKTADLSGMGTALSWAARKVGVTVDDYTTLSATEASSIGDVNSFLDLAEYRLLNDILGNLDVVDITVGPRSEKLSQIASYVMRRIATLESEGILDEFDTVEYKYIDIDIATEL